MTESRIEAVFDVLASRSLDDEQKERVVARVGPVVSAIAQDARSQARNRELALERLRDKLTGALKTERRRRPTRPGAAARERRIVAKRITAQRKQERRRPDPGAE